MSIVVTCDCGRQLRARDELAGKKGKCPGCGRELRIPQVVVRRNADNSGAGQSPHRCQRCGRMFQVDQAAEDPQVDLCGMCLAAESEGVSSSGEQAFQVRWGVYAGVIAAGILLLVGVGIAYRHNTGSSKATRSQIHAASPAAPRQEMARASVDSDRPSSPPKTAPQNSRTPSENSLAKLLAAESSAKIAASRPADGSAGTRGRNEAAKTEVVASAVVESSSQPSRVPMVKANAKQHSQEEPVSSESTSGRSSKVDGESSSNRTRSASSDRRELADDEVRPKVYGPSVAKASKNELPSEPTRKTKTGKSARPGGTRSDEARPAKADFRLTYQHVGDPAASFLIRGATNLSRQGFDLSMLDGFAARASEDAMMLSLRTGERSLRVLLDPLDPPAVFFDTGTGRQFYGDRPIVGHLLPRQSQAVINPGYVFSGIPLSKPEDRGTPIPTAAVFWYRSAQYVRIQPEGWLTGMVRFGGAGYRLAIVDGDFDGRFDSTISGTGVGLSDYLGIDLNGDGKFDTDIRNVAGIEVQPLTAVVEVEGNHYQLEVDRNGRGISVTPVTPKTGLLVVDSEDVEMLLVGENGLYRISGPEREWTLPVGRYTTMSVGLARRTPDGVFRLTGMGRSGRLSSIALEEDSTLKLKVGPPLELKPVIQRQPEVLSIGLTATGRADEDYIVGTELNGRKLSPPRLRIVDERGRIVHQGAFEYG